MPDKPMTLEQAWKEYSEAQYRCGISPVHLDYQFGWLACAAANTSQLSARDEEIAKLREALYWCSGSPDFQEGGRARKGWLEGPGKLLTTPPTGDGEQP